MGDQQDAHRFMANGRPAPEGMTPPVLWVTLYLGELPRAFLTRNEAIAWKAYADGKFPADAEYRQVVEYRQAADLATLRAENERLRRDAERYRVARDCARRGPHGEWMLAPIDPHRSEKHKQEFDADIDAAIQREGDAGGVVSHETPPICR